MKSFALSLLFLIFVTSFAIAGKPTKDLPITQIISDYDANFNAYSIQSDGGGAYQNGINGDISVLMANVNNGLTWGDRLLENGTIRKLAVTFSQENAVQPGDPGYVAPPSPPLWGTVYTDARFMNKCTAEYKSFYTMMAGDKMICEMHISMTLANGESYRLDMGTVGENETQKVQISCNANDVSGCTDWFIDPIPVVNPDGSTSPGKTRARLNGPCIGGTTTKGKPAPCDTNHGGYYMTFHVHVTRP